MHHMYLVFLFVFFISSWHHQGHGLHSRDTNTHFVPELNNEAPSDPSLPNVSSDKLLTNYCLPMVPTVVCACKSNLVYVFKFLIIYHSALSPHHNSPCYDLSIL